MTHPTAGALEKVRNADRALALLAPLADLLARLYIARVFLLSGWSKISDWDTTLYLFTRLSALGLFFLNIVALASYWHVLKDLPVHDIGRSSEL
jgi:uncharacterized membrane protein YphA (DoxX/SURF4 family)